MAKVPVTIDGKALKVEQGSTILDACRANDIDVPVMCHFDGLSEVGACRLCLVEIEGVPKLLPSCATRIEANQVVRTTSERLQHYRRLTVELFFSERNHICSVCVANNHCELQDMAQQVGMDHVRFPYLYQDCKVDASHKSFVMDHNRCIMCTRCVRVCNEVEGAHNWDVKNRGYRTRIIADFDEPWGESGTCTSCGKCLQVCPTGALWPKDVAQGQLEKMPESITELVEKRKMAI